MTLDLQGSNMKLKQPEKVGELLSTPDVSMFMLASPDLERYLMQQNGLVLTTPTPTQILFPKGVTMEQEAYARGFVEALGELHKTHGPPVQSTATAVVPTAAVSQQGQIVGASSVPTTVYTLPTSMMGVVAQSVNGAVMRPGPTATAGRVPIVGFPGATVKMELAPQTVPATTTTTLPLPPAEIQPIDMDEQEMAKLERKRARNRVAATRCRNRKLERISRLEERVAELKAQNAQLMETAALLRDEVCRLKSGIIEHTRHGCQVMLTHNLL